ncbi:RanBD1 domain-containing protein [Meloidogyne graminicola]|uniref:RanBD1 domain-containing protein n=1 Tax=Meloidogyne graminicola TaxID=189291 RepID=A0A8S9ZX09_9BILA|nr:RanBD1 domain-containing protein [Meloidogyne graminicola]
MSSKPNLFGGFSAFSNSETVKDNEENEGEETDERPEEFTPKDNFQPIVPLPSKVETKSGEESEEVIYETRCRLFRFDKSAKEFRARGTGDIKILLNKQTNRYRCIARNSEAISKIITNFTLFSNFKIEKKEEKPTCLIWRCKV